MIQHIDAIYDNGVLRPLEPLALPDQSRVKLTVDAEPAPSVNGAEPSPPDAEALAKQNQALEEMRREIARLPQHKNNDGWSVRQHDELLYGSHK